MKELNKLESISEFGDATIGDWKAFFDRLVREHGTDTKIDFYDDLSGVERKICLMEYDDNYEFYRYDRELEDEIYTYDKYIKIYLNRYM